MHITFYGAAQNVTGSKHLIETNGFKVLLDCGLNQGPRLKADGLNRHFPFDAKTVNVVILSHAHADHCGLLPLLVREGFSGDIFCTTATKDIVEYILLDCAHLQQQDADYYNDHLRPGEDPIYPFYTEEDVQKTLSLLRPVPYFRLTGEWTKITEDIRFKFYDAGHILGSAITVLEITEKQQVKTLAFSGDIGGGKVPLLVSPETISEEVQTLLMECTYGNRVHPPVADAAEKLVEIINRAVQNKSKIFVPAFSLGRTQEIIYILHKLTDEGRIPRLPIYIDSPLSNKISKVFEGHEEDFNAGAFEDFGSRQESPFLFRNLHYVNSQDESKALNHLEGPFMVVSASGMMEGGRILHHLMNGISNPHNIILITGYQAEGTLGRKIQEGVSPVRIFHKLCNVNAQVITLDEFSAHADRDGLVRFVENVQGLTSLFLVHTEAPQAAAFKSLIKQTLPGVEVVIPSLGQEFTI